MRAFRSLATLAATGAITTCVVLPGTSGATVPSCPAVSGPGAVEAVTRSDGAVFYRCEGDPVSRFVALGGRATSPPSVVTTARNVYFLVTGTDHNLYVRTLNSGWTRASASAYCIAPAMALAGSNIVVACKGSNGQLYTSTAAFSDGGLPRWTVFRALGGQLSGGPALGVVAGVVQYYVVGSNSQPYENTGTPNAFSPIGSYTCVGGPAVTVSNRTVYLACNSRDTHAVLYAANARLGDPAAWPKSATSLGGVILGTPAIVARDSTGATTALAVFAIASNGVLYKRTVIPNGAWTSQGGGALRGVGAAQLAV